MTNKPTWETRFRDKFTKVMGKGSIYGEERFLSTDDPRDIENFIEDLLAEQRKELIEKIKNHKFTLYSARKALIDGNFVLPEEETVDVFDYKELLDLLKQD